MIMLFTHREFLRPGIVSSPKSENIGAAVGQYIALIYEWSKRNPDGILDNFKNSIHATRTTADLSSGGHVTAL